MDDYRYGYNTTNIEAEMFVSGFANRLRRIAQIVVFILVGVVICWQPRIASAEETAIDDLRKQYPVPVYFGPDKNWTTDIALGDLDGNGKLDVVVAGSVGIGKERKQKNRVYFSYDQPFSTTIDLPWPVTTPSTSTLALGDINGDGSLDIVVSNYQTNTMLYMNKQHASDVSALFTPVTLTLLSQYSQTTAVALGDLNGDGRFDLVAGNANGYNQIYLNTANSSAPFSGTTPITFGNSLSQTSSIAIGKLDGNDLLDVVVGYTNGSVEVYTNMIDSTNHPSLTLQTVLSCGTLTCTSLAIGNIDLKNGADIVIDGELIYTNTSSGGLVSFSDKPIGVYPQGGSVALADFDYDKDLDILVGVYNDNSAIWLNSVGRPSSPYITWGSGYPVADVAVGDIDSDGDLDIVMGNNDGKLANAYYLRENALPFAEQLYSSYGYSYTISDTLHNAATIALGDLNNDQFLDIVVGDFYTKAQSVPIQIYFNNGQGGFFSATTALNTPSEFKDVWTIAIGDLNNDHLLDIVAGSLFSHNCIFQNQGGGQFSACKPFDYDYGSLPGVLASGNRTRSIALGDMNNDSWLDIVVGNVCEGIHSDGQCSSSPRDGARIGIYLNGKITSTISFSQLPIFLKDEYDKDEHNKDGILHLARSVALGDLDHDGRLDIVVGNLGEQTNENSQNFIYFNESSQRELKFRSKTFASRDLTTQVAVADIDGDSNLDIIETVRNGPDHIFYNKAGMGDFSTLETLTASTDTDRVATGDINGDGKIDFILSEDNYCLYYCLDDDENLNRIWAYLNEGQDQLPAPIRLFKSQFITDNILSSLAVGDLNNDGMLDLVVARTNGHDELNKYPAYTDYPQFSKLQPIQIYMNNALQTSGLPGISPKLTIEDPDPTSNANFYATPWVVGRQTSSGVLTYTINYTEPYKVARLDLFLSLDGGGQWQPVTSTFPLLQSSPISTYQWQPKDSLFGQSDNVVFRVVAYPQMPMAGTASLPFLDSVTIPPYTVRYTNSVPAPTLWSQVSATTLPFRAQGRQIHVQRSSSQPVSGAKVYRQPTKASSLLPIPDLNAPLFTDNTGNLLGRGQLQSGDRLVALAPVTDTNIITFVDSAKYEVFDTSAKPNAIDLDSFAVTNTQESQLLTVTAQNKLLLFNLNVSLEWDAREDKTYLAQLERDLQSVSRHLYDWTDGQVALGEITLYNQRQHWDSADIRIYASNRIRPNAVVGGIVSDTLSVPTSVTRTSAITYTHGQVRIGATWNRFGNVTGDIGEDWPKILAHELGHYLLFLQDNYFGFDQAGTFKAVGSCHGVMYNPYPEAESEFYPSNTKKLTFTLPDTTKMKWPKECSDTLSEYATGRSDWATIQQIYPFLDDTRVPPLFGTDILSGPIRLTLSVTQIKQDPDSFNNTGVVHAPTIFNLVGENGQSIIPNKSSRAFYLTQYKDKGYQRLIDLGSPVAGQILARGVVVGDLLCMFEQDLNQNNQKPLIGCTVVNENNDQLKLKTAPPTWPTEVLITPGQNHTLTVSIRSTEQVSVTLYPDNGSVPVSPSPTRNGQGDFEFEFSFPSTIPLGYLWIWSGDAKNPTYSLITDYTLGDSPGFVNIVGQAPVISADGQVLLYNSNRQEFLKDEFYSLQSVKTDPKPHSWLEIVGHPQRLISSSKAPDLRGATIIFNYLESEVPARGESWLHIFYYDEYFNDWRALPVTTDFKFNYIAAPVQGPGLYALMATIESPPLRSGWEQFPYPETNERTVPQALASIRKAYSSVYWRNGDNWWLYDRTVPTEFFGLVNYNDEEHKLLTMKPLESYWIFSLYGNSLPYIGVPTATVSVAGEEIIHLPPATFYGWVEPSLDYTPTVGAPIVARIDNIVCGIGQVEIYSPTVHAGFYDDRDASVIAATRLFLPIVAKAEEVPTAPRYVYKIQIRSDTGDGCGVFGREITFEIAGRTMPSNHPWGNSQACFHPLGPETKKPYSCFTFAAPDLVVDHFNVTDNSLQVIIRNSGTAAVPPGTGFWIDAYINPGRVPVAVNETWQVIAIQSGIPLNQAQGLVWNVKELAVPFEPTQVMTFTVGDENYRLDYSNFSGVIGPDDKIYAQVDSANKYTDYGGVLEVHEMLLEPYNNIGSYPPKVYLPLMTNE